MQINIHIHHHHDEALIKEVIHLTNQNNQILKTIMATQQDVVAKLDAMTAQAGKIKTEVEKVLAAISASDNASPELLAAADNLQAAIQGVDDLNKDEAPSDGSGDNTANG